MGDPAVAADSTTRLFQYGSNMDEEAFNEKLGGLCRKHAPPGTSLTLNQLGAARLDGWRFRTNLWSAGQGRRKREDPSRGDPADCRVANIVQAEGGVVWGVLYEIASPLVTRCDGERSLLDCIEGPRTSHDPENYAKICVTVDLDGAPSTAWTYIGLNDAITRCETKHAGTRCGPDYVEKVIRGAEGLDLPEDYLDELRTALAIA